jgi:S-formylglutathione hydrolase FrmB
LRTVALFRRDWAAYDSITEHFPGATIWVHGKSIGGLGALYLAATRSPHAIVVRNIVDVSGIAAERVVRGIRTIIPAALDARRWAAHARCPALFVVSSADRFARPTIQRNVVAAYGGPADRLDVAGAHDDRELKAEDLPRYAEALVRHWIR